MRLFRCDLTFVVATALLLSVEARFLDKVSAKSTLSIRGTDSPIVPAPIVVPPSQYFEGDNGNWSTFNIRVGTPAQSVRVLVSTNSPITGVVQPGGCELAANVKGVPTNCVSARGGIFNANTSTSWQDRGYFSLNSGSGVGFEANLDYDFNLDYGLETLALGYQDGIESPRLVSQTVATYTLPNPLYMGFLGIGTQPVIYTTFGNYSVPSFFKTLEAQSLIPSLSWSFTAGASYRLSAGQLAQLIFGGYDKSRFIPNELQFTLSPDVTRDIVVAVQSIMYSSKITTSLLPTPIYAFIESTDPNIWLPIESCRLFEEAFDLIWDNVKSKYLLVSTSGGATVDIVLPFSAFGSRGTYPFVANASWYFPLQRARDPTQYTLGRSFLQEAYLIVDYDRGNFSVSQCTWVQGNIPEILTILPTTNRVNATNGTTTVPATEGDVRRKFPVAVVVGATIGGLTLVVLILWGVTWCWKRTHTKSDSLALQGNSSDQVSVPKSNATMISDIDESHSGLWKAELDTQGCERYEVNGYPEVHEAPGGEIGAPIPPIELHEQSMTNSIPDVHGDENLYSDHERVPSTQSI